MAAQPFVTQPIGVKLAVAVTFYNSFVLLEEFVIDRHGLARYLPLYRVGDVCTYDGLALAIILLMVFVLPGDGKHQLGGLVHCLRRVLSLSTGKDSAAQNCFVCRKAEVRP